MFEKTATLVERYNELSALLSSPKIANEPHKIREYAQEQSELAETVQTYLHYCAVKSELSDTEQMLAEETDSDMVAMIRDEVAAQQADLDETAEKLKLLLVPKDPRDSKNVIFEIRAGAGGDEAGLFAADLYRMYSLYAAAHKWKTSTMSENDDGFMAML